MSSLEPQTSAKCTICTSVGPLKLGLWARECPQTVSRFLKNCAKGSYDGVSFERKVFDAAIQTAEIDQPTWGALETNSRIKMDQRGLVAVESHSKGAFFVTLRETTALNGKVTVIGKLVDNSYYTLLEIASKELKSEPSQTAEFLYPATIESILLDEPYFEVEQGTVKNSKRQSPLELPVKPKRAKKASKVLLQFEEEEDDGDETLATANMKISAAPGLVNNEALTNGEQTIEDMGVQDTLDLSEDDQGLQKKKHESSPSLRERPAEHAADDRSTSISKRERDTLELLAKFKQRSSQPNSITSHHLDFGDAEP
ncbi:LADA_0D04896g1_1 [Lachancea dasiensis]|uniref:LADA_0D04896g1_1 n=1 Tax=Lachancea dasiensis TaxID=1072105 RepID=A0A1G4J580_9SACH|nr:LADA_0D04896g1_1 [Lachancea dasiensis]